MRITVLQPRLARQGPVLLQQFNNNRVGFPNRFADQLFRQSSRRALGAKNAARRIHRAIHRDSVALTNHKVFLSVAGSGMNGSRTLF